MVHVPLPNQATGLSCSTSEQSDLQSDLAEHHLIRKSSRSQTPHLARHRRRVESWREQLKSREVTCAKTSYARRV